MSRAMRSYTVTKKTITVQRLAKSFATDKKSLLLSIIVINRGDTSISSEAYTYKTSYENIWKSQVYNSSRQNHNFFREISLMSLIDWNRKIFKNWLLGLVKKLFQFLRSIKVWFVSIFNRDKAKYMQFYDWTYKKLTDFIMSWIALPESQTNRQTEILLLSYKNYKYL